MGVNDYLGEKIKKKEGKRKADKKSGKIFLLGGGYNPIANRKRRKKGEVF